MTLADELQKLEELRRSGTLSHEEFEIAKRKVLGGENGSSEASHLEDIKAQNELARLDREWTLERESYMITGQHGQRHIPKKASSALVGVFVVGFGIFWTAMATSMTGFGNAGLFNVFPLFGVFFIAFGVFLSIRSFQKAGQYEEAEKRYRRRRREIIAKSKL